MNKFTIEKNILQKLQRIRYRYFSIFSRISPINEEWGFERGQPIDRYYIEKFISLNGNDIGGDVLSIGDDHYAKRFAVNQIVRSDVLHVDETPQATIVADLTDAPHIPTDRFDCILLIQTIQLIYDLPAVVQTIHRILKPGGVVLVTAPGITPLKDPEWNEFWQWNFTDNSLYNLFTSCFSHDKISITTNGNVTAATAFLHGLAVQDIQQNKLAFNDKRFPVIYTLKAQK